MKKKSKKLPYKQTINLIEQKKAVRSPVKMISGVILIFLLVTVIGKFAILDRFLDLQYQRLELTELQNQQSSMQTALKDYQQVQTEYNKYTTNWMTNEEKLLVDRKDVLKLIAEEISPSAQIQQYSVTDNVLSIDLIDVTLDSTAKLAQRLEARDEVEKVQVYTANSQFNSGEATSVSLVISLQNEESIRQREAKLEAEKAAKEAALNNTGGVQ